jgi:hypothetical protein
MTAGETPIVRSQEREDTLVLPNNNDNPGTLRINETLSTQECGAGVVFGGGSVIFGGIRQFLKASFVPLHRFPLLKKENSLYSQNEGLKQADHDQPTCKSSKLPLDFYFLLVLVCGFAVIFAAWLIVNGNCLTWRSCGGLLMFLSFVGLGCVFWGLGNAIDCEAQQSSYRESRSHGGNYITELFRFPNTGST